MDRIVTLKERKAAEVERRRRAVDDLRSALASYAAEHDGRFLLFGSAARGDMRYDSDVDILVDFPSDTIDAAWTSPSGPAGTAAWSRTSCPDRGARLVSWPTYSQTSR